MNRFELLPDEKIVIETPKHWRNYILPTIAAAACIAAVWLRIKDPWSSLVNKFLPGTIPQKVVLILSFAEAALLIILLAALCFAMVDTAYTRYYVTNKRIISVTGWFNVRIVEMRIDRVETVSLSQRPGERIFNSGDILCVCPGASIYLDDVFDARRFRQTVMRMVSEDVDALERRKEEERNSQHQV